MKENRLLYLDVLKLFATLGVICIHVSGSPFVNAYGEDVWYAADIWDGISRWCVPLFVMVSGAMILPRCKDGIEKDGFVPFIKGFYIKRLGRLFFAYIVWQILYDVYSKSGSLSSSGLMDYFWIAVSPFVATFHHLWFLPMIMAMYVLAPVIAYLLDNDKLLLYIIVVWFFVSCLAFVPFISITEYLRIEYVGYFVCGYYLANHEINLLTKRVIYCVGCLSVLFIIGGTAFLSIRAGEPSAYLFEYLTPPVIAMSVAVFVLIKERINNQAVWESVTDFCRRDLFGIYLIHIFVRDAVRGAFKYLSFDIEELACGYVGIPVMVILVFVVSLFAVKLLRLIPGVRKIVE